MGSIYLKEKPWGGSSGVPLSGYGELYTLENTPQTLRYDFYNGLQLGVLGVDFYETGGWTPKIWDVSLADGDASYVVQWGFYMRYSIFVYVVFRIELSTHVLSGDLYLAGLPYTCNGTHKGGFQLRTINMDSVNNNPPNSCEVLFSQTYAALGEWDSSTGITTLIGSDVEHTSQFWGSGWYVT